MPAIAEPADEVPAPAAQPERPSRRMSKEHHYLELATLRQEVAEHAQRLQDMEAQLEAQQSVRPARNSAGGGARGSRAPAALPGPGEQAFERSRTPPSPRKFTKTGTITPPGFPGQSATALTATKNASAARVIAAKEADPYDNMWSHAKLKQMRMFDQDLLKSIYNKPYKEAMNQAALLGTGIMGLLAMPFGPIGMAAGGMFGALCGGLLGFCADKRRRRRKVQESELEKKRLKSLVRWAAERFNEDDEEVLQLIEMVTLEFKPMADIATGSKNARKLLKLLDSWVAQRSVSRQLWAYMDKVLQNWQELSRGDFIRGMLVFQTLTTMYRYSHRMLDEQEAQFVQRMERLLDHPSVKSVMAHAQQFPTHGESRVMECMVYADHARQLTKRLPRGSTGTGDLAIDLTGLRSPTGEMQDENGVPVAEEEVSDDSDVEGGVEEYQSALMGRGMVLVPSNQVHEAPLVEPKKILKKPFFKDWDDFMDFDSTFKHKMPITLSEFGLLKEKEQETTKGWDICVDRKEIRVAKIQMGVGGITLRAWATVSGVNLYVAFYLFHNFNERVKWDKVFATMSLVGEPAQGSDILYSLMKVPGITPRDFLQYRRARLLDDGSILLVLRSAEHPDMPENKNYIRAESHSSGYILRQIFENGEPVLSVFLMSCSDVKGLIPKWLINMVAPKKPAEWVETLRKACREYQEANPNYEQDLWEYANRYKAENPYDYEVEVEAPAEGGEPGQPPQRSRTASGTSGQQLEAAAGAAGGS